MWKLIKKFIDWLFEPDDYDGVTRFDVITVWAISCGFYVLIAYLINNFC